MAACTALPSCKTLGCGECRTPSTLHTAHSPATVCCTVCWIGDLPRLMAMRRMVRCEFYEKKIKKKDGKIKAS